MDRAQVIRWVKAVLCRVERIKSTTDKFGEAVCAFANDMPF